MKKIIFTIFACLSLCFGCFGLTACDNTDEIKSISVDVRPSKTIYVVGENIDLTDGILKIEYVGGNSVNLPLSVATPSIYTFNEVGAGQYITLSYQGKETHMGVTVNKRDIVIDKNNVKIPSVSYNMTSQPVDFAKIVTLPQGTTSSIEYKLKTADDSTYTTNAPINAGDYLIRVSVNGGTYYNNISVENENVWEFDYTILPTDLKNLSTQERNYFDYNITSKQNTIYGESIDFTKLWTWIHDNDANNDTLGLAPLPTSIREQIKYEYRLKGATNWTSIDTNTENGIALPAGEYELNISLKDNSNINPFEKTYTFNVSKKDLTISDFVLKLQNSALAENVTLSNSGTVVYANGCPYSLNFACDLQGVSLVTNGVTYEDSYVNKSSIPPSAVGTYSVIFNVSGGNNYKDATFCVTFSIQNAS